MDVNRGYRCQEVNAILCINYCSDSNSLVAIKGAIRVVYYKFGNFSL